MSLPAVDICRGAGLRSFTLSGDCTRKGTTAQATRYKEAVSHSDGTFSLMLPFLYKCASLLVVS